MYNKNEIVTFKLLSGEEVVARYCDENHECYEVYKPLTIMPQPQGLALVQTVMGVHGDQNLKISKIGVLMHGPSREEMAAAWIESTSGLKVSKKDAKILMG